jgi:hypothetical protein
MGEKVRVGNVSWVVPEARKAQQLVYHGTPILSSDKQKTGDFVIVDYEVTNDSEREYTTVVIGDSLVLTDDAGNEYKLSKDSRMYLDDQNRDITGRKWVRKGGTEKGTAIYAVKPAASGFVLHVPKDDPTEKAVPETYANVSLNSFKKEPDNSAIIEESLRKAADYANEHPSESAAQEQPPPAPASSGAAEGSSEPFGSGCPADRPIKGNISQPSGELIYHVPGGRSYAKTKPEQCFATEANAQAAGFRPSKV